MKTQIEYIEFNPAKHIKGGDIENVMNALTNYVEQYKRSIVKNQSKQEWKELLDNSKDKQFVTDWFRWKWHMERLGKNDRDDAYNPFDALFDVYKIME